MFECDQDTALLQNALISAVQNNSGNLQRLKKESKEKVIDLISNSINVIIEHSVKDANADNLKRRIEAKIHIQKRLHAALLYNVLRFYDISSDAADSFYGSVSYRWPLLDFDLYLSLNYRENWSQHFIKCVFQLPEETLLIVLKHVLVLSYSYDSKYYVWHQILQSIYVKLMKVSFEEASDYNFSFDFVERNPESGCRDLVKTVAESLNMKPLDGLNSLIDVVNLIYDELNAVKDPGHDVLRLELHAMKTLMKYQHRFCGKEVFRVYDIVVMHLSNTSSERMLKEAIDNYNSSNVSEELITAAWGMPVIYLVLLNNFFCNSLLSDEFSGEEIPIPVKFLRTINPFAKNDFHVRNNHHLEMLFKIIEYHLDGAAYAAEILLSNSDILENERALKVLENNCCVIDFKQAYPLIMESVLSLQSQDSKLKLLKFFYKLLSENSVELYNVVLKKILLTYGPTNQFRLPDYDEQLSLLVRQASSIQNAEHVILGLFVQSPTETLKCLIDEILSQGEDGKYFVQILELIPQACTFIKKDDAANKQTPLIEILIEHIQKDKLEEYESKNFPILFQLLMEFQDITKVLDLNLLIQKWAVPYLENPDKFPLLSSCLKVIFKHLTSNEILSPKQDSPSSEATLKPKPVILPETLKMLISSLGFLIHSSVESGSGRTKESYMSLLNELGAYQLYADILSDNDRKELETLFSPLNEVVCVYSRVFLTDDYEYKHMSTEWIRSFQLPDSKAVVENFLSGPLSYADFLNMLVQVVPHLTADEWKFSLFAVDEINSTLSGIDYSHFIQDAVQYFDVPFPLSDSNQETYALLHSFIMSLCFTLPYKVNESLYTCSCFCSALDALLKKLLKRDLESPALLILVIYLDLCFLISNLETYLIPVFSPVQFEMKEYLSTHHGLSGNSDLNKLLINAIDCLPDSTEKNDVLKKMEAFL